MDFVDEEFSQGAWTEDARDANYSDLRSIREWYKMQKEFANSGYREGVSAGKESVLQGGFDEGFSSMGVPLGRCIGKLRGVITALLFLSGKGRHSATIVQQPSLTEELMRMERELAGFDVKSLKRDCEFASFNDNLHEFTATKREHDGTSDSKQSRLQVMRERVAHLSQWAGLDPSL